jgi:heptosyltransferase II
MAMLQCRHFSGYKPCGLNDHCDVGCKHISVARPRILLVHLEALGAVLRATSLLPAIKRKYPHSHITWVTKAPAHHLLKNNPMVDRVLTLASEDLLSLKALDFDLALVVDKSIAASGIVRDLNIKEIRGFGARPESGAIVPLNAAAEELWRLGLSDHLKFFVNKKPETQLLCEALDFAPWSRDEYVLQLSSEERTLVSERRAEWSANGKIIIGLNTGCSTVIPYKKWTVAYHRQIIRKLGEFPHVSLILLGGSEDSERNGQIANGLGVIQSPTTLGLRDGLASVAACDLVITGDSLGMHMAIALKKWVVAWFGPTCAAEIDLYDRGVKLETKAACAPCWKRSCSRTPMCYDQVPMDAVKQAVSEGIQWIISSYKQPSSAISCSPYL